MKQMTRMLLVMASLLTACMGGPADGVAGSASDLIVVAPGTIPLAMVPTNTWLDAPDGCRDRLPSEVEFRLTDTDLVVAFDALGRALCVDTVNGVRAELEHDGRLEESADLAESYLVALGRAIVPTGVTAGDPSPQPSTNEIDRSGTDTPHHDPQGIDCGDPSPQPSTRADVDPEADMDPDATN